MIKSIQLRQLRNAEYLQFLKLFLQLVNANDPTALKIINQYKTLEKEYQETEALFKLPMAHEMSSELLALDVMRDRAIVGISFVVKGYLDHFDTKMSDAAMLLDKNLELYGAGISIMNYQAETATISGIVRDWANNSKLSDAANLLGLADWQKKLEEFNIEFEKKYNDRTQDYGSRTSADLLSKRKLVNTAYYELNDHIQAHQLISKTPNYTKVINEINALIDQYNTLLAGRKPEKKDDKKDEGKTPTEE